MIPFQCWLQMLANMKNLCQCACACASDLRRFIFAQLKCTAMPLPYNYLGIYNLYMRISLFTVALHCIRIRHSKGQRLNNMYAWRSRNYNNPDQSAVKRAVCLAHNQNGTITLTLCGGYARQKKHTRKTKTTAIAPKEA